MLVMQPSEGDTNTISQTGQMQWLTVDALYVYYIYITEKYTVCVHLKTLDNDVSHNMQCEIYVHVTSHIEIDSLSQHGVMLPPNMIGLTVEQVQDLKLKDELGDVSVPSGGYIMNEDPVGRRNGKGMRVDYVDCFRHRVNYVQHLMRK